MATRRSVATPAPAVPAVPTVPAARDAAALVRDTCVCLNLQRAARSVGRVYDEKLRPVALTHEQFSLLMSLARDEPPGLGALAAELELDRTTLTANLKPLQRRGLLDVLPDPADGRARRVQLTARGRRLLAEAYPLWQAAQRQVQAARAALPWPQLLGALRGLTG